MIDDRMIDVGSSMSDDRMIDWCNDAINHSLIVHRSSMLFTARLEPSAEDIQ